MPEDMANHLMRPEDIEGTNLHLDERGHFTDIAELEDQVHRFLLTLQVLVNQKSDVDGLPLMRHFGAETAQLLEVVAQTMHDRVCNEPPAKNPVAAMIAAMMGMTEDEFESMFVGEKPSPTLEQRFGMPPSID